MLVDDVTITVTAGHGGKGAISFSHIGARHKGGPDGGDGGKGGDVYIVGSPHIADLREFRFKKRIEAKNGEAGGKNNKNGKGGADNFIEVPLGTDVYDLASGEVYDIADDQSRILIARGGKGGKGNTAFKSSTNRTPREFTPGDDGEKKEVRLNLRLIAHVGLIGLPNAGKSSLLKALTHADPKIASYPFTTLQPNLGIANGVILADIPGLIEGASEGKGLGFRFLKHIEKTRMLAHCIDVTTTEPLVSYDTVRKEFSQYDTELLDKREIVILTKTDLATAEEIAEKTALFSSMGKTVFALSVYQPETLTAFSDFIRSAIAAESLC